MSAAASPFQDPLARAAALARSGQLGEAERLCRQALKQNTTSLDAARLLAQVLRAQGRVAESVEAVARVAQARPKDAAAAVELGAALHAAGQLPQAVAVLERAARMAPTSASAQVALGRALLEQFRTPAAIRAFTRALELSPGHPEIEAHLGSAHATHGAAHRALPHYDAALAKRPDWAAVHAARAAALRQLGRMDEAVAAYRRARELRPEDAAAIAGEAEVYEATGRADDAARLLDAAVASGRVSPEVAMAFVPVCERRGEPERAAVLLEGLLADPRTPGPKRSIMLFALGSIREQQGRHDEAFDLYRRANEAYASGFNPDEHRAITDAVIAAFSPERFAAYPRASSRDERPVFIVGMARSGTSLVEQILASHPAVYGAGELVEVHELAKGLHAELGHPERYPGCLGALTAQAADRLAARHAERLAELAEGGGHAGAARVTDKMPQNFMHLGLIALLFPGARIIHCVRDPMDTCLSCYTTRLSPAHGYSNRLDHLASMYRDYRRIMDHWTRTLSIPVLDVVYERLVRDQEAQSRRLVEFVGLPWDDRCLSFHRTERVTRTASMHQVRRPMYATSVARWKKFEHHLGPLKEGLAEFL